ncbi:MAG: hypothetical protein JKY90_05320 [Gammaproteobacteria bacterium]|nr:hypothetical protein [Gammaproteobacteria bacterium]
MSLTQKLSPLALATSLAIAGMTVPMVASATGSFSANAGVASDYLFRGISQTGGEAAVSGGVDWDSGAGFYVGVWGSNVGGGTTGSAGENEIDYYVGYAGEAGALSYDIGLVALTYTREDFFQDYEELVIGLGYGQFSFTYIQAFNVVFNGDEQDAPYFSLGYDLPINDTLSASFVIGNWDINNNDDYTHFDASLVKSFDDTWEASIGFSTNDNARSSALGSNSDEVTFVVSVGASFDL